MFLFVLINLSTENTEVISVIGFLSVEINRLIIELRVNELSNE